MLSRVILLLRFVTTREARHRRPHFRESLVKLAFEVSRDAGRIIRLALRQRPRMIAHGPSSRILRPHAAHSKRGALQGRSTAEEGQERVKAEGAATAAYGTKGA